MTIKGWAVVELMGHQVIAGEVGEEMVAGTTMLRVDVPEIEGVLPTDKQAAFTRFFGGSAVYSLTPTSEEVARRVAADARVRPVTVYMPEFQPRLPASKEPFEDFDEFEAEHPDGLEDDSDD